MRKNKNDGTLTPEELALWQAVNKGTVVCIGVDTLKIPPTRPKKKNVSLETSPAKKSLYVPASPVQPDKGLVKENSVRHFDPLLKRKIKQGKRLYQASLDLHGATQQVAYTRLVAFITQHYAAGNRLLLVITGKGTGKTSDTPFSLSPEGVLFKALPLWLESTDLSLYVHSYTLAHREHGGDGAYYVYLRRFV